MKSFRHVVPSINALVTLEAAVRCKSFTAAAAELNVSQAAVTKQVRALEIDFGMRLFDRLHRRVEPTPAAAMLGATLTQALGMIRESVETLRPVIRDPVLTVGTTIAFSQLFLLPRLPRFRQFAPKLQITFLASDEPADLSEGALDIDIRYGVPPVQQASLVGSFSERFFPVCAPSYAARADLSSASRLLDSALIEFEALDPNWMYWIDWFDQAGVGRHAPKAVLKFNRYTDCIAAAIAGEGIALGWERLVAQQLTRGDLVRCGDMLTARHGYNLLVPIGRPISQMTRQFIDWLTDELEKGAVS